MSHLRDVVQPRRRDTTAILLAHSEPCIQIAADEALKQSGRRFIRSTADELGTHRWPASWCMAVVLCQGDTTRRLSAWAASNPHHLSRIHFYLHESVDARSALAAWHERGLPIQSTWDIRSWKDLAKHFGARLNMQCHDDFCNAHDCPLA